MSQRVLQTLNNSAKYIVNTNDKEIYNQFVQLRKFNRTKLSTIIEWCPIINPINSMLKKYEGYTIRFRGELRILETDKEKDPNNCIEKNYVVGYSSQRPHGKRWSWKEDSNDRFTNKGRTSVQDVITQVTRWLNE